MSGGGWVVGLAFVTLTAGAPGQLGAQTLRIGPVVVGGDYREVADDLQYQGGGFGAAVAVTHRRVTIELAFTAMTFDPTEEGAAIESFDARQFDLRARYYLTGPVSAEVGVTVRRMDPDFAAQSAGALRLGARLANEIGPGVRLSLRGAYLAGARFSGGGSAPLGVEIGLGVAGDLARGRLRIAADYEFQYFNRKTGTGVEEVSVPIQQTLLRLGAAVGF